MWPLGLSAKENHKDKKGQTVILYDDFQTDVTGDAQYNRADFDTKWFAPFYGLAGELEPGDGGNLVVDVSSGNLMLESQAFQSSSDFLFFDHIKAFVASTQSFDIPEEGSITLSADIKGQTYNTEDGLEMRAMDAAAAAMNNSVPVSYHLTKGRQAGVTLHLLNLLTSDGESAETGQLFDWFVTEDSAFMLIERLFWNGAGIEKTYTQIVKVIDIDGSQPHNYAIRYERSKDGLKDSVVYLMDGREIAKVKNIGIPLDDQKKSKKYKNIVDPSDPTNNAERVGPLMQKFAAGMGLFSLLDQFPYQQGPLTNGFNGVTIPVGSPVEGIKSDANGNYVDTRIWGQGATGMWDNVKIVIDEKKDHH